MTPDPQAQKHWFVTPALTDRRFVGGGLQIFNRLHALVSQIRPAHQVTYRKREQGVLHLDDLGSRIEPTDIVWVTYSPHITKLAERLAELPRIALYAQAMSFGAARGQVTPPEWPIVCLSRFIAADYSIREPWRCLMHLPAALHPQADNHGLERDIDVLVHRRKSPPYILEQLVPALEKQVRVEVLDSFLEQEEFLRLLNRTKVYLYWFHKTDWDTFEGFGMQPLEAIACGCYPVSNFYGGLSDYLESPFNCLKIGTHSLDFDVLQIVDAVKRHSGDNPDRERLRAHYSEERLRQRFRVVERQLSFYFDRRPPDGHGSFKLRPDPPPLHRRARIWLHRQRKRLRGRGRTGEAN